VNRKMRRRPIGIETHWNGDSELNLDAAPERDVVGDLFGGIKGRMVNPCGIAIHLAVDNDVVITGRTFFTLKRRAIEKSAVSETSGRCRRTPVLSDRMVGVQPYHAIAPLIGISFVSKLVASRSIHRNHLIDFALHLRHAIGLCRACGDERRQYPYGEVTRLHHLSPVNSRRRISTLAMRDVGNAALYGIYRHSFNSFIPAACHSFAPRPFPRKSPSAGICLLIT
jgi:hypothetical protein